MVLGIAQDAGYPQIGCRKACCQLVYQKKQSPRQVTALGIVDASAQQKWLVEATPHIKQQLLTLNQALPTTNMLPNGILLTHAHIGHYTGLMQLGREALGAKALPVFTLPRMTNFLRTNGPWDQLVALNNIALQVIQADSSFNLNANLSCTPLKVPHRDEYSETAGYLIKGKQKQLLFIPDIDKWQKWERSILELIQTVDYALLDGTFFKNGELPNRDMSEIPHPFVEESMRLMKALPKADKAKVHFIHLNHTNPLLFDDSTKREVEAAGFRLAYEGQIFTLK